MQPEDEGSKLESAIKELGDMGQQPVADTTLKDGSGSKENSKNGKDMLIGMIILAVLTICGIGISVWVMMDGNAKMAQVSNDVNELKQQVADLKEKSEEYEEDEEPTTYGRPNSAVEIDSISISYNGYRDFIDIVEDGIDYYSFNDDGSKVIRASEKGLDTDTSEIMKNIFDNYLEYLTEFEDVNNYDWSIEVYSSNKACMISGTDEYPEWFGELLTQLNVSEYGNYSIKNT